MKKDTTTDINSLRRICFTGVRGVGKTTLLKMISKHNPDVFFISGSDIMQKLMGESYDLFEFMSEKEKHIYRLKLNDFLWKVQHSTGKSLLVDCHLTVYNMITGGIDMIFTQKDLDFFTDLILLNSTPEDVYSNRKNDTNKPRILEIDIIKRELDFERKMALKITKEYGIKYYIIQKDEKSVENLNRIIGNNF